MSSLRFDGLNLTLQLYSDAWELLGEWPANNITDHRATMRFVPNGRYPINPLTRTAPQTHPGKLDRTWVGKGKNKHHPLADSVNGEFGTYGIIILDNVYVNGQLHHGVGVHSGRESKGAQNHPTMGCIRTIDVGMDHIAKTMANDPLLFIVVQNAPYGQRSLRHSTAHGHGHGHHHVHHKHHHG